MYCKKLLSSFSKLVSTFLFFIFLFPQAYAQDYSKPVEYIKNFTNKQEKLPKENIFIHTDRDLYYEGDRVWFSVYVVTGGYNFLSELSKILHLELVEPSGKLIKKFSIKLENGRGDGNIYLNDIPSGAGTYQLKAYTLWGLNFGVHNKFIKNINIVSGKKASSGNNLEQITDVQFFPEGGPLLVDTPTRIGIKAIDENGLGKFVSGSIYNENGAKITNFKTEHLGMGVTEFTPASGTSYYAMVDGNRYDLPQIENGVSISVDQTEELFNLEITRSNSVEKDFLLFTHIRGKVYNASPLQIKDLSTKLSISKEDLATGVVHFTLLNSKAQPVSERVAFNKNSVDQLDVSLSMDKDNLKLRTRAEMEIQVKNGQSKPKLATASVSIFDESINNYNSDDSSIESTFYLESELKGYIEKPGYYFSDAPETEKHLDLLLMTQGWKAFNSSLPSQTEQLVFDYLPQEGFSISGEILTPWTSKPIEGAVVALSVGDGYENMQILTTDKAGRFSSLPIVFEGEQLISIRANKENGKDNLKIKIDDIKKDMPNPKSFTEEQKAISFGTKMTSSINNQTKERISTAQNYTEEFLDVMMKLEMEEITVTAKREAEDLLMKQYTDQAFSSIKTVDFNKMESYRGLHLTTVLQQFYGYDIDPINSTLTRRINTPETPITILLDGIYVDYSTLAQYKTDEIQSMSYIRTPLPNLDFNQFSSSGGALIVKTRSGIGFRRGFESKFLEGVQAQTIFYSPKYGVNIDPNSEKSDQRITLHWDPKIDINEGKNITPFWTNDVPSTYRIVVQGLTDDGIPFTATEIFEVTE